MGVHTGEGRLGGDDYVGLDVHVAARISSSANGGQVLASAPVATLAADALPPGASLRDLGDFRLKDIDAPQRLFQLAAPGLLADVPAPRSLDARPHNLPSQLTGLVGRDDELGRVADLLGDHRLVTLMGAGGAGKSRLAIASARQLLRRFKDGAFFVPLEAVTDEPGLLQAIQHCLALTTAASDVETVLHDHLRERELLLVLDNFEQLTAAGVAVSRLLAACPGVRALVTSQVALRVRGEQTLLVEPLALPPTTARTARQLESFQAVSLDDNAGPIAEIARRLDGMPLAIELAAARARMFPPAQLAERLARSLDELRTRGADVPARHRTLRSAIDWSYSLLTEEQRRAFAHLAVFTDGFGLDAVEAIAPDDLAPAMQDAVEDLLDKSLVTRISAGRGQARFRLLTTLRAFALARLEEMDARHDAERRLAEHLCRVVTEAAPELRGPRQIWFIDVLDQENDNLRAAALWCLDNDEPQMAADLAAPLWTMWQARGRLIEGRRLLEPIVDANTGRARAVALDGLGAVHYWLGAHDIACELYQQSAELFEQAGDERRTAEALYGVATSAANLHDADLVREASERVKQIYDRLDDPRGKAQVIVNEAVIPLLTGDKSVTRETLEQAVTLLRELGDERKVADSLVALSFSWLDEDAEHARELALEQLSFYVSAREPAGIVVAAEMYALAQAELGQRRDALRLAAACEAQRVQLGGLWSPAEQLVGSVTARVAEGLDGEEAARLRAEGEALSLDELIERVRGPT
jgi:predicted ATPase